MILSKSFSPDFIRKTAKLTKTNPDILQKSIYAFALLEKLVLTGLPFIFKGGTCLMLLLDNPRRLSTDVDILVDPKYKDLVNSYLEKACDSMPFINKDEVFRNSNTTVPKRHFEFQFDPLTNSEECDKMILDVVFEENCYASTLEKDIKPSFTLNDENIVKVTIPSAESIAGDKLTAAAPNTCGVPYFIHKEGKPDVDKRTEVAKQFFDVGCLFDNVSKFDDLRNSFKKIAPFEISYRGNLFTEEDCLIDTIRCCLSILSNGNLFKTEYEKLKVGFDRLRNFVFGSTITERERFERISKVLLISSSVLKNVDYFKIECPNDYELPIKLKSLRIIKTLDDKTYKIICASIYILGEQINQIIE